MILEDNEGQEIKKSLYHLSKFVSMWFYVHTELVCFLLAFVCMVLMNVGLKFLVKKRKIFVWMVKKRKIFLFVYTLKCGTKWKGK